MLCFRASQIWSHLICGRRLQMLWTDIYLNRVCAKVLWDQCLQSIIGYRAVETWEGQFIENDGVRIWLEKMLEITSTEIRTSVLDTSWSCHGQAICQLFEMKRFFLFIGNLAACIVENVSTQAEDLYPAEWIVPDKSFFETRFQTR